MDSKKVEKHTKTGRKINPTSITSTSSLLDSYLQDCQQQPPSPASSSTSQTTGDTTFEPSIDMMVNDFDDEQTLTEEEALAELEAQDPADEIETLHKESEMPLEMLLAHYRQQVENDCQEEEQSQSQPQKRHKRKKSAKKHKQSRSKHHHHHHHHHHHPSKSSGKPSTTTTTTTSITLSPTNQHSNSSDKVEITSQEPSANNDEVIVIEESEDEIEILKTEQADTDAGEDGGSSIQDNEHEDEANADEDDGDDEDEAEAEFDDCSLEGPSEQTKLTALALLYPDKYAHIHDDEKMDDDCSDDDEDDDDDYVKKTIMVGAAYQATIPVGLSKYGDVLPYENEDKLVWEASQVSEPEVEDYLIRVKEIKSSPNLPAQDDEIPSSSASVTSESDPGVGSSTVKDDEQALHLLVQCGYNFKEALRRRRLNAVPLTGTMSIWSEEECRNFEEGIQKFGKDFRKIQKFQVRTRSIRELVQFYYLWKKTERRDQEFVDSDTIDHMDAYLDFDERDTAPNNGNASKPAASSCLLSNYSYLTTSEPPSKRHHHSNFSIMNETNRSSSSANNHSTNSKKSKKSHRRRSSSSSLLSGTKSKHHDSSIFTKTSAPAETTTSTEEAATSSSLAPASSPSSVKNWRGKNTTAHSPSSSSNHTTGGKSSSPPSPSPSSSVSLATNLQGNNLKQK